MKPLLPPLARLFGLSSGLKAHHAGLPLSLANPQTPPTQSNHATGPAIASKNTDVGTWHLDMVNNRLYWSDETYRIFGCEKKGFLPYYGTFYKTIHPEDRASWTAHRDLFIKGAIPMNIEYRIVLPTGEIRHVHQSGKRTLDMSNRLTWLSGTVRDITKRKSMQEESENLSMVAAQISNPVIVFDIAGNITWVNDAFVRTYGFEFREVVAQKPGKFLLGPDSDPATLQYLRAKFEKQEPFEVTLLSYSKSGRKFWMRLKGQPIFDKTGKCSRYIAIQQHITR